VRLVRVAAARNRRDEPETDDRDDDARCAPHALSPRSSERLSANAEAEDWNRVARRCAVRRDDERVHAPVNRGDEAEEPRDVRVEEAAREDLGLRDLGDALLLRGDLAEAERDRLIGASHVEEVDVAARAEREDAR